MPQLTSKERREMAEMILYVVERKFLQKLPEEVAARIRQTTVEDLLSRWLSSLYITPSIGDFQQRIQG